MKANRKRGDTGKNAAFLALAAEVEPLVLPWCEAYQSGEQTREKKNECLKQCTSAIGLIQNYLNTYYRQYCDSLVLLATLHYCLENYRPAGKTFMHLFMKIYWEKRPKNESLLEKMDTVDAIDADTNRDIIRRKLREFLACRGITGARATEMLHAFFSNETLLSSTSRMMFLLKKVKCTDVEAAEFEQSVPLDHYVVSLDKPAGGGTGYDNRREAETEDENLAETGAEGSGERDFDFMAETGDEAEEKEVAAESVDSSGFFLHTVEESYALAKDEAERKYLRCCLTLTMLKEQDNFVPGMEKYIDTAYFREHQDDNWEAAYQEALTEAGKTGKSIQKDAFVKRCLREAMARHLSLQPSTVDTYCVKGHNLLTKAADLNCLLKK